jgi:hypothetical protein
MSPAATSSTNTLSNTITMSEIESTTVACRAYAGLPYLSEDNFTDWDMQVIAYLTSSHNHVCVIMPVKVANTLQDPTEPLPADVNANADDKKKAAEDITNWQKSE